MHQNTELSFAVAGCGDRLSVVIDLLLKELSCPVVIHAYDPDPVSIAKAQERWKVKVIPHTTWEEALSANAIQWAFIGSWNCFHRDHVIAAFKAGKNVFAEKPLATSLEDCLAMRDAWKSAGTTFFFGLVLRYSAFYQRVFTESRKEKLGDLISFEFNETLGFNHGGYIHGNWRRLRKNAGTHLLEKCCHDIDLAHWIAGSLPVRIASFGGRNFFKPENKILAEHIGENAEGRLAYETWNDRHRINPFNGRNDIVDNQVVILEYANGTRATFHTNCNAAIMERRFYLLGSEGAVRANSVTGEIDVQRIGFETKLSKQDLAIHDGHAGGDEFMARHLAKSILEGAKPIAGMDEALRSAITCFGIDQALDEGRVVDLTPLWKSADISVL